MKNVHEDFDAVFKAFRQGRVLKYDKKYNREHDSSQKNAQFAELYEKIEKAIGTPSNILLHEYTDSVIALYHTDEDCYYDCGFDDCQQLYKMLFKIAPVFLVDDKEDVDADDLDV